MVANYVHYSNALELITLIESDMDSQLELRKATENEVVFYEHCKDIIHFLQFLIFGFITLSHIQLSCIFPL